MRHWRALPVLLTLTTGCAIPLDDAPTADERMSSQEARAPWEPCTDTARLLKDIAPGAPGSEPESLVHGENGLFFTADDGLHGRELWVSSGTRGAGTFLVKDIHPGPGGSEPGELTVAGGKLFFTADDGVHGRELWVSDGTAAGTFLVKDIHASPLDLGPSGLVEFNGLLYFAAEDEVNGRELWRSDGTAAGTFLVEDLYPGDDIFSPGRPGSSSPRRMTRAPNAFYFVANVGEEVKLWRSVGLPGATPVFEAFEDNVVFGMTPVGNELLFFLVDPDEGEADLWVTRGTLASTRELRFFPGNYPRELTALKGKLYFSAGKAGRGLEGDPAGEELWVSDGTVSGTRRLVDIHPGAGDASPGSLTVMNHRLFFAADDGVRGRELWVSDGTAGGTRALGEIAPVAMGSSPTGFIRSGWDVFFTADDGAHGREPWALPFRPGNRCGQ